MMFLWDWFNNYKMVLKQHKPGDSKWPFDPLVGGHQQPLKGSRFHHSKKVTIAELPGDGDLKSVATVWFLQRLPSYECLDVDLPPTTVFLRNKCWWGKLHGMKNGEFLRVLKIYMYISGQIKIYFTKLDFCEIRGFPFLSYLFRWDRVRSL